MGVEIYHWFSMTTQLKQVLGMKPFSVMSTQGILNWTRVCMTPLQSQDSPQRPQSPSMYPVHGMTLKRAAVLRSQPRDLGLTSSTPYLLLPHKPSPRASPNPPHHSKISPTSKVSAVLWTLRSTPSPTLQTASTADGQMRKWPHWRKSWA